MHLQDQDVPEVWNADAQRGERAWAVECHARLTACGLDGAAEQLDQPRRREVADVALLRVRPPGSVGVPQGRERNAQAGERHEQVMMQGVQVAHVGAVLGDLHQVHGDRAAVAMAALDEAAVRNLGEVRQRPRRLHGAPRATAVPHPHVPPPLLDRPGPRPHARAQRGLCVGDARDAPAGVELPVVERAAQVLAADLAARQIGAQVGAERVEGGDDTRLAPKDDDSVAPEAHGAGGPGEQLGGGAHRIPRIGIGVGVGPEAEGLLARQLCPRIHLDLRRPT